MTKLARILFVGSLVAAPSLAFAQPQHEYKLNNSYADTYAGPSLVDNGGSLSASGYAFLAGQGLSLAGVVSSGNDYSLVLHFMFNDVSGYRRVLETKNGGSDCGYYVYSSTSNDFCVIGGTAAYTANTWNTTVLTRNGTTGAFNAYVNGVLSLSSANDGGVNNPATDVLRFFWDDAQVGGENSAGSVDYISVYDRELSGREVADLDVDATPEPASLVLVATGLAGVAGVARRRRKA